MEINFRGFDKKPRNPQKLIYSKIDLLKIKVSEYPQKLKILKATFSWFSVFLFD